MLRRDGGWADCWRRWRIGEFFKRDQIFPLSIDKSGMWRSNQLIKRERWMNHWTLSRLLMFELTFPAEWNTMARRRLWTRNRSRIALHASHVWCHQHEAIGVGRLDQNKSRKLFFPISERLIDAVWISTRCHTRSIKLEKTVHCPGSCSCIAAIPCQLSSVTKPSYAQIVIVDLYRRRRANDQRTMTRNGHWLFSV